MFQIFNYKNQGKTKYKRRVRIVHPVFLENICCVFKLFSVISFCLFIL